jgi:Uma2 family endonuclease
MAQDMAMLRKVSVYEDFKHPNEEAEHEEEHENHVGWRGSKFYAWFGNYDERVLRPFLIRNYDPDIVVIEDEY